MNARDRAPSLPSNVPKNMSKRVFENMLSTVRIVLNPLAYIIRMSHQKRLFSDPHGPVTILAYTKMYKMHIGTMDKTTKYRPSVTLATGGRMNNIPVAHMSCTHMMAAANLTSSRNAKRSRFNRNTRLQNVRGACDIGSSETRSVLDSRSSMVKNETMYLYLPPLS